MSRKVKSRHSSSAGKWVPAALYDQSQQENDQLRGKVTGLKQSNDSMSLWLKILVVIMTIITAAAVYGMLDNAADNVDILFQLKGDRFKIIRDHLSDRIVKCRNAFEEFSRETDARVSQFRVELAENNGFEGGDDAVEGKRLRDENAKNNARRDMEDCMDKRLVELEAWKTKEALTNMTMPDTFDWVEMLHEHGMCEDKNECFCVILLHVTPDLKEKLEENQKKVDEVGAMLDKGKQKQND